MGQDQIAKRWRKLLIHELQDRYGLAKEQAQEKADVWLRLVQREPQSLVTAAVQDTGGPSGMGSRVRSNKSRSAAATAAARL